MNNLIKKEVNNSILLIDDVYYNYNHNVYKTYDKMMAFGGDNFSGLCDKLNLSGKNAFVVTGAGDQTLELVSRNFENIISYDINVLARHILNLKCAAIMALDYDEFILFSKTLFRNVVGMDLFYKCEPFLNLETKEYFCGLFALRRASSITNNLFTHRYSPNSKDFMKEAKKNFSMYRKSEFLELKKKLLQSCIYFREINVFDIQDLKIIEPNSLDFIYLSNIPFFASVPIEDFVSKIIPELIEMLSPNGIIIYHYFHHYWNVSKNDCVTQKAYQKRNDILYHTLKDYSNLGFSLPASGFGHGIGDEDYCLGLKKF